MVGSDATTEKQAKLNGLAFLEGAVIDGKYRIMHELGRGNMGAVFQGEHLLIKRPVAIKVIKSDMSADEEALERFKREAVAASKIDHHNAVTVYDFGLYQGHYYLVMQLIKGKDLRTYLADCGGNLSAQQFAPFLEQICSALAAAHRQGVIHRDLKPANIMISLGADGKEQATVLDFGVAKIIEAADSGATNSGTMIGSPRYISPEQARGLKPLPQSDIYALGVMTHEILSGKPPFEADSVVDIVVQHLQETPPPLNKSRPDGNFSPELDAVVARAMAKDPMRRFSSAEEFAEAFKAAVQKQSNFGFMLSNSWKRRSFPLLSKLLLLFAMGLLIALGITRLSYNQEAAEENFTGPETAAQKEGDSSLLDKIKQYEQAGAWDQAVEAYKQRIDSSTPSAGLLSGLGSAYRKLGRVEEAAAAFKQALSISPTDASALYGLGAMALEKGKLDEAQSFLNRAAANDPLLWAAQAGLCYLAVQRKQANEAVHACRQAVTLRREDAVSLLNLGYAHIMRADYPRAQIALEETVRLQPNSGQAHNNLGFVYEQLGQKADAIEHYRMASKIAPNKTQAEKHLERLQAKNQ